MTNVSYRWKRYEPPESPHFFKIILSDTLQSGKLCISEDPVVMHWVQISSQIIPKKFVAKYGDRLPNQLLLKVAGDGNWPVELEKCDGRVWICKGWRNFMDYYSIDHGHLIVFRLEGASSFHVLIFDKSATEIEYPQKPVAPEKLLDPEVVEIDDVSTELGEHVISPRERRELKSPLWSASPEGKGSHSGDRRTLKLKKNVRAYCSSRDNGGITKQSEKRATPFEQINLRSRCPNPPDALKRARKIKSEHPSFLIVVRRYYLEHSNVHVPGGFMKNHIKESLVVEDSTFEFQGRSWTVKFFNYPNYYCGKFSAGWTMFASDNSLSAGDVCVFEMIKKTPMVFKVLIFRHTG